jgi:hypothetical protein
MDIPRNDLAQSKGSGRTAYYHDGTVYLVHVKSFSAAHLKPFIKERKHLQ